MYGWTAIISRCNTLQSEYAATQRKLFYVHKDNLGSTIALSDGSGNLVQSYEYDAFGKAYVNTGSGAYVAVQDFTGSLYNNDRFFTGREFDRETDLYFFRARYYDASLGRFISRDPIGMTDQINLYAYVHNNPLGMTDPSGRKSKPATGSGGDDVNFPDGGEE